MAGIESQFRRFTLERSGSPGAPGLHERRFTGFAYDNVVAENPELEKDLVPTCLRTDKDDGLPLSLGMTTPWRYVRVFASPIPNSASVLRGSVKRRTKLDQAARVSGQRNNRS